MASYIDILNARERMIAALATMIHPDEFPVSRPCRMSPRQSHLW
ncbi:MAG: hypothetical protein ACRC14_15130 [Paracoccaceae bacterium]